MSTKVLERAIRQRHPETEAYRPFIFRYSKTADRRVLSRLLRSGKIHTVIDDWPAQMREYRIAKKPSLMRHARQESANRKTDPRQGVWVYYPWLQTVVHALDEKRFSVVRLSRNANLIRPTEQKRFRAIRVGIAGCNVGNPAALCLALEGGASAMKLADNDALTLSNLNRFRARLSDLGLNKATLTARQIYEIDPFVDVSVFPHGITIGQEETFLLRPRIDILIEETDNLKLKIALREKARAARIPVLMVTGNGANIILDVERYDRESKLRLLNGHLRPQVIRRIHATVSGRGTFQERILLARDFMGAAHLTSRLRESFVDVGTRLAGIPQLSEASFLRGAVLSYVIRRIAVGDPVLSGRYALRLEGMLKAPRGNAS